jgi:hypothetical protein
VKLSPPATGTGTFDDVVDPVPSCPDAPFPQQYAVPLDVRPQVLLSAAVSTTNLSPPLTRTGWGRVVVELSPSWPCVLFPQHQAVLSVAMPQAWDSPATIDVNATPPRTATGTDVPGSTVPLPSAPE